MKRTEGVLAGTVKDRGRHVGARGAERVPSGSHSARGRRPGHPSRTSPPSPGASQDLTQVHASRHTQRVEHDIDRVPSSRNGMSSMGRILAMTPLLP